MAKDVIFLITRPLPEGGKDTFLLTQKGLPARKMPLQDVTLSPYAAGDPQAFSPYAAVLFTSARAFLSLTSAQKKALKTKEIFGVGTASAQQILQSGIDHVAEIAPTAKDLVSLLKQKKFSDPLLYLRGQEVRMDLKDILRPHGIIIDEKITYALTPRPQNLEELKKWIASSEKVVVLLQSISAARCFQEASTGLPLGDIHALCQSPAIACALTEKRFASVSCASEPTGLSLRRRAEEFFRRGHCDDTSTQEKRDRREGGNNHGFQ